LERLRTSYTAGAVDAIVAVAVAVEDAGAIRGGTIVLFGSFRWTSELQLVSRVEIYDDGIGATALPSKQKLEAVGTIMKVSGPINRERYV
jgi:hypothetical protein